MRTTAYLSRSFEVMMRTAGLVACALSTRVHARDDRFRQSWRPGFEDVASIRSSEAVLSRKAVKRCTPFGRNRLARLAGRVPLAGLGFQATGYTGPTSV